MRKVDLDKSFKGQCMPDNYDNMTHDVWVTVARVLGIQARRGYRSEEQTRAQRELISWRYI